jgi:hypothetical protein
LDPNHHTEIYRKYQKIEDRVRLDWAEIENLSTTLLYHYTHTAASRFPISPNIGIMDNAPPPHPAANSLLTTDYDTFITQDAITDIMADQIGDIRDKFSHVNDE